MFFRSHPSDDKLQVISPGEEVPIQELKESDANMRGELIAATMGLTNSYTEKKRTRKDFGKHQSTIETQPLLELQLESYHKFLQAEVDPEKRQFFGLHTAFQSVFSNKNVGEVSAVTLQCELNSVTVKPKLNSFIFWKSKSGGVSHGHSPVPQKAAREMASLLNRNCFPDRHIAVTLTDEQLKAINKDPAKDPLEQYNPFKLKSR
jgi:hypothetical protein